MLMLCTCALGVHRRRSSDPHRVDNDVTRSIANENAGAVPMSCSGAVAHEPRRYSRLPRHRIPCQQQVVGGQIVAA
jgi:hypothetical protein